MPSILISDILVQDRQRRSFPPEALAELAESIKTKGLLHPIVLRDDARTLVAGERRLRAHELLGLSDIPYTLMRNLSEREYYEAELEENVVRQDLSMAERVAATAALHNFRLETNPSHSLKDTAREISGKVNGHQIQKVSDACVIADHLDNPAVARASSEKEALKIIYREATREIAEALADTVGDSTSPHTLIRGDALELLQDLPDASIDVICTDPPYGIGADTFGDQGELAHAYDDSPAAAAAAYATLARESFRAAKPRAHLYAFCDFTWVPYLTELLSAAGWTVWPTPLIWFKGNQGILPRPDHGPRRAYETILYALKGDRPVTVVGALDVLSISATGTRLHAAEKPVDLYRELLRRSALPGDTVLDPFCGSGPIFPAASALSLKAIGFELNAAAHATAKLRMEDRG